MNDGQARRKWSPGGWWRAWLWRRSPTPQHTLTLHNLYVLPTRAGWMLTLVLGLLLLGSINYQLNLGYALTFALAGAGVVSVWMAHANLVGLTLSLRPPDIAFAGQRLAIDIVLADPWRRCRWSLALRWLGDGPATAVWTDTGDTGVTTVPLPWTPPRRGRVMPPALVIETRYPLGIARIWSVWQPAAALLVAPTPEMPAPALPRPVVTRDSVAHHSASHDAGGDEARPYRSGDAPRRILWRKAAQHPDDPAQWTVRSARRHAGTGPLWLDEANCELLDPEARRARLCAWVLQADAAGLHYGLRVGTSAIAPGHGPTHRRRCLEALACA